MMRGTSPRRVERWKRIENKKEGNGDEMMARGHQPAAFLGRPLTRLPVDPFPDCADALVLFLALLIYHTVHL